MPDLVTTALALPGLWWLVCAITAAGLVRGFTGFGSAMIIMPAASSVLDPFAALAFLTVVEFWGPLPNLRAAWREGVPAEAARLLAGAAIGLPLGLWALSMLDPAVFGWSVSVIVLVLLVLVMSGWRYGGTLSRSMISGVGGLGGLLGGIAGVPGPPVIMLYMASALPIAVIRANFLLYLLGIDLMMIAVFLAFGLLDPLAITVGLLCVPLYMGANMLGARLFDPQAERLFRAVAYIVIAASAVLGLPVWE
ncbi:sulfite exporter TauE/SafE family protein [uncultured Tateyamaria sp.]|uniref:sulfite exporter TauE/SafE family protein n=1 Tax=uncultured Tateyamaria sp. TaxID=455651 RepID=UPI002604940D|nr:sulfite exporter TauE/SafE family protein [uncultured Tateyamaria sp.]